MRKLVATISLTLDGVMQAPGRPDEDRRGGFEHGGWAGPYHDPVMMKAMGEGMAQGADLLFGRRTYEDFFAVWPGRTDNPFTAVLDRSQKYVASRTLREPLPWQNSTLLAGDAAAAVAELKKQPGKDLAVLGSGAHTGMGAVQVCCGIGERVSCVVGGAMMRVEALSVTSA
jgi:dihydrofolate reductase